MLEYDDDIDSNGTMVPVKGNQVVDTPEFMVKAGLIYKWEDFEVVPMLRFMGSRYADAENTEKVDSYVVADLHIATP